MVTTVKKSTTPRVRKTRVTKKVASSTAPDNETVIPSEKVSTPFQFNNLLVIALVVLAFFSGYLYFKVKNLEDNKNGAAANQPSTQQQAQQAPTVSIDKIKALFADGFLKFGNANSKILFVEISDPSCPFCHVAAGKNSEISKSLGGGRMKYVADGGTYTPVVPEMKKLVDQGKASFVWIYSPGHGNGELATQALYCAYEKNKFWEAHDLLMNNQGYEIINNKVQNDKANIQVLVDYLAPVVDSSFLSKCLQDGKYAQSLTRDQQVAQTLGYNGTPDFFVNTTNFQGAVDYKSMDSIIKPLL
ncbi:thioredoxin domain-containing protein [Candidatus Roizmanbacteria bacterium]|nr:thioredoxin domain-containing protein [Candidatus Roizmanbacteria bacterium]